ncbi:hypothetical protein HMSSN139_21430 [Paenibacillus sp. HMSSN-139]|nr:hypothetical protein HMSSN139_21430 [Paenibacillus sp. HMSSN-139]
MPSPLSPADRKKTFLRIGISVLLLAAIVAIAIPSGWLTFDSFIAIVGVLGILIPTSYFIVMFRSPRTTSVERSRLIAYIPLFIAAIMFWAIQEQGSTILANYADKRTQLDFAGIHISPAWFQSLNPLFIITLAPVFAWFWLKLGKRQPSIPKKFALGLLFAGLSFLVILLPAYFGGEDALVNPLWLVLSYFIVVLGELCLSPVGLSATTKLAPSAFSAQTMSLWFLSSAAAQAMNAQVVKFYSPATEWRTWGHWRSGHSSQHPALRLLLQNPRVYEGNPVTGTAHRPSRRAAILQVWRIAAFMLEDEYVIHITISIA